MVKDAGVDEQDRNRRGGPGGQAQDYAPYGGGGVRRTMKDL